MQHKLVLVGYKKVEDMNREEVEGRAGRTCGEKVGGEYDQITLYAYIKYSNFIKVLVALSI